MKTKIKDDTEAVKLELCATVSSLLIASIEGCAICEVSQS